MKENKRVQKLMGDIYSQLENSGTKSQRRAYNNLVMELENDEIGESSDIVREHLIHNILSLNDKATDDIRVKFDKVLFSSVDADAPLEDSLKDLPDSELLVLQDSLNRIIEDK